MSSVQLDSTTYHYQAKVEDAPDVKRAYTKHDVFRPDNLSFDIHVTRQGHVYARNIAASGQRVLKDRLSEHRLNDRYDLHTAPTFVQQIIEPVLELHRSARHGTGQALPRAGAPERPEHRACRARS